MRHATANRIRTAIPAILLIAAAAACSDDSTTADEGSDSPVTVRLGYFPNLTHATAIVGVEQGQFASALGPDNLDASKTFNAGPEAVEALLSGAIDATYIGANPAINAFSKSNGGIRIISGATSGGAFLVVRDGIDGPDDLEGKKLATPQLGGTQDVALRWYLQDHGLATDTNGGGDVSIQPQENAETLEAFKSGAIDGAWVPEPWATRLITEGAGKALVDEADLWPDTDGAFVTTHLIVRTEFLEAHPATVKRLLQGQIDANASIADDPAAAQASVAAGIKKITGKDLKAEIIATAWENLTFTNDPVAASLQESAEHANGLGLPTTTDLDGIYDLGPLNALLKAAGNDEIDSL